MDISKLGKNILFHKNVKTVYESIWFSDVLKEMETACQAQNIMETTSLFSFDLAE